MSNQNNKKIIYQIDVLETVITIKHYRIKHTNRLQAKLLALNTDHGPLFATPVSNTRELVSTQELTEDDYGASDPYLEADND